LILARGEGNERVIDDEKVAEKIVGESLDGTADEIGEADGAWFPGGSGEGQGSRGEESEGFPGIPRGEALETGAIEEEGVVEFLGFLFEVTATGLFLCGENFATAPKDEIDAGGIEKLIGDGGGNGGVGLVGVEGSYAWGGNGTRGDDADGAPVALSFIEEGIGRFSVVAKAETPRGARFAGGEEGSEGGGIAGEVIGGLGFDESHGIGAIETGEVAIRIAGLGECEEFGACSRDKKDDDAVGTDSNKVANVASREADEGEEDGKGDELWAPPFHGHKEGLEQNGNGVPFLLGD